MNALNSVHNLNERFLRLMRLRGRTLRLLNYECKFIMVTCVFFWRTRLPAGYGNVAPRTEWGKVATILYAIIGMPLFLLYLSNIGDILAKSFKWIYAKVCLCRICPGVAKRRALRERRKQQAQRIGADFSAYQADVGDGMRLRQISVDLRNSPIYTRTRSDRPGGRSGVDFQHDQLVGGFAVRRRGQHNGRVRDGSQHRNRSLYDMLADYYWVGGRRPRRQ